ncbi:hypothetical protein C8R43DRAFT_946686 [Mycena crocata]|nr:hypothetical protein C8R43DRAFT_946686 [Mycena crocata]
MAHLPPTLCAQGVSSKTFTPPPDTSLTVPEHSEAHPLYIHIDESTNEVTTVPWRAAVQGIYRIAHFVVQTVRDSNISEKRPTIGLCSTSGYPLFLISPFASPAALGHLINISGVQLILMNADDPGLRSKLSSAVSDVQAENPNLETTLLWSQIFSTEVAPEDGPTVPDYDMESTCIILHSSGSTTLPRLNLWTHRMVATALWQPWYGERDVCGEIMSAASVPMSGAAGTMLTLFPASSGLVISGLKPQSPPTRLNPMNVWKAIVATKSTYAFILQPFIYMFSEDDKKRKILAQLKGVVFGGGPLRKPIGDQLALEGANLLTFFGSSEGGLMNKVFTANRGTDWEFFSFYSLVNPGFIPQEDSDLFEFVIKTGDFHRPAQKNTVYEDAEGFASKDLLQPHREHPGFWKYVGRMDDQISLSGAMKINAVAFEQILVSDSLIRGAIVFSQGPTFGVIIDPVPEYAAKSDLSAPEEQSKLKSLIWSTAEQFNQAVGDLGRLNNEKPFVYGEKGLPRRKEVIDAYVAEIEAYVGPWE